MQATTPPPNHATGSIKGSVQNQFGAVADRYAASPTHASGPDLDCLVNGAALTGRERVLDVGCGTGYTTLALAAGASEVHGLDLTDAMLEEARRKAQQRGVENVRFRRGDAEALPYPDRSFDVVSCRVAAHHFPSVEASVREAARVLKPGGAFLVSDSISPENAAQDTFLNCIELLRDASHVRNHRVSEWLGMLRDAGFDAETLDRFTMHLDFDAWFERMQTPHPAREQVRTLFRNAATEVQHAFAYDPLEPTSWLIPIGVMRGRLRSR